ncbi:MAG: von Willebrand factor type A domain-containing protein [Verrucomicrobium sp.]
MKDKLTAYALNELPPDDRAALEAQMASDPALREEAEAMKAFCGLLHEHVGKPEEEVLTSDQRNVVLKAFLSTPRKVTRPPFWKRAEFISTAIAAGLALTLLVPSGVLLEKKQDVSEIAFTPSEQVNVTVGHEVTLREGALLSEPPASLMQESQETRSSIAADAVKPSLGPMPASPLAMPPPIPAPITAPAPSQRGAFGVTGSGSPASSKEQPALAWRKADAESARGYNMESVRAESASGVAAQPALGDLRSQAMNEAADGTVAMSTKDNQPVVAAAAPAPASAPAPAPARPLKPATSTRAAAAPSSAQQPADAPAGAYFSDESKTALGTAKKREPLSARSDPAAPPGKFAGAVVPSNPVAPMDDAPVLELGKSKSIATPSLQAPVAGKPEGSAAPAASPMPTKSPSPSADHFAAAPASAPAGLPSDPMPESEMLSRTAGTRDSAATSGRKDAADKLATDASVAPPPPPAEGDKDVVRLRKKSETSPSAGETYTPIYENPFQYVAQEPLSTFSIDVDTASYANVRRFLNNGQRPPANAVRLEELINYFPYAYETPADDKPFAVHVDVVEAPWKPEHRLARIALKGKVNTKERAPANFVFLVDVSGSMDEPDKLPLVKKSLLMLTEKIGARDHVALVTYAGSTAVALPSTAGEEKSKIVEAIEALGAGGSTNGAGGIRLAYEQAQKHLKKEGTNRVILCTDGDFNVGISSPEELEKLIAEKAKSRVFLSVLGFGTGNLKDRTMETLADKGNGNYAYIDSLSEARKVLVEQMNSTLVTIAKDVKIQVEFNPGQVQAYRLLGYENRIMAKQDFNNDRKDAGEIGEGHTVTALYEIVPTNVKFPDGKPLVDSLKYAPKPAEIANSPAAPAATALAPTSPETMTVKLRYKQPDADTSVLMEVPVTDKEKKLATSPADLKFAASVAGFGMLLRDSQHAGDLSWDMVRELALAGKGPDELGYRGEFLQLVDKARGVAGREQ